MGICRWRSWLCACIWSLCRIGMWQRIPKRPFPVYSGCRIGYTRQKFVCVLVFLVVSGGKIFVKLTCKQQDLSRGLSIVGHAVSSRSTLPILANILLSTDQ